MNTRQLIRNAFLLPPLKPTPSASAFIADTYVHTLLRAGAVLAAHVYLRISDSHRHFLEPAVAASVDEAVALSGPLTANLNKRFGLGNAIILDADDPSVYKTLAAMPNGIFDKTCHPFINILHNYEGQGIGAIKNSIKNSFIRFLGNVNHAGAALHAFHHNEQGSRYNPYSRMAIAHFLENTENPITYNVDNSSWQEQSLRIISMAKGRALDIWSNNKMLETPAMKNLKWFFIFSHELGHAVESHDWKESLDSMLSSRFDDYSNMDDGPGWLSECHADVFSACLCAKLSGNWDHVKSVILPFRAIESGIHNTYGVLSQLTKEDPSILAGMDERSVMLYAAKLTEQIVSHRLENNLGHDDRAAAKFTQLAHGAFFSKTSLVPDLSSESTFKLSAHRVQAMVDAVATDSLYSGSPVLDKDLHYLAHHFRKLGQETSAKRFMEIAEMPPQERISQLIPFARQEVIQVADRMTSNIIAIDDYMASLRAPERMPDLPQKCSDERRAVEAKTPAF